MTWPKTYSFAQAPRELLDLVARLMPLLLVAENATCAALRQQYACAEIRDVELTGHGFFVNFAIPPDAPRTEPSDIAGGGANIQIEGVEHGAGCVLFVRGGVIAFLEGFVYAGEWPEHPVVLAVSDAESVWSAA
jgi:hypothetical protein